MDDINLECIIVLSIPLISTKQTKILTELTEHKKNPRHMTLEIHVMASDRENVHEFRIIVCVMRV
jgi:hypothetical protein